MKAFDSFRALLRSKAPVVADLHAAVVHAEAAVTEAEGHLAGLQGLARGLLTASDTERETHRRSVGAAEATLTDARLYLDELQARLAGAQADSAETDRRGRYDAAKVQADAAAKALAKEYPALASRFVVLLQQVNEAEEAVQAVNADLPSGAAPLLGPEAAVRDEPGLERKVVRERAVDLWCDGALGRVLPEHLQGKVQGRGKTGTLIRESNSGGARRSNGERVEKRRFVAVEFHEATRREWGPRLAEMVFPGLHVRHPPFWSPGNRGNSPRSVLERIQQLVARKSPGGGDRELLTELIPVTDPQDAPNEPAEEDA